MNVPEYEAMQRRRRELIAQIEAIPPEERDRAEGRSWSALAVLEHMNIVDGLTLKDAEIATGRGTRNPFLPLVVRRMRSGRSVPAPPTLVPTGKIAFATLVTESDANHARLGDLVARAGETDVIARHPVFGPLSPVQACDLLDSHYEYHLVRFLGARR